MKLTRYLLIVSSSMMMNLHAQDSKAPAYLENPPFLPSPSGYSQVAKIDLGHAWLLLISGQVSMDQTGQTIGIGNFGRQTEQVYSQIISTIEYYGGNKDHLVKTDIFILDAAHIPALREIRKKYVNTIRPPASTAVVVKSLFRDEFLIEIDATAVIPRQ